VPLQGLVVGGQGDLGGLALAGELIEITGPVEILYAGDPASVRVGLQIAPGDKLIQSGRDSLQG
jgi:hypothetical protein